MDEVRVNVLKSSDTFHGVCIDTGAQRSVISVHQAEAYMADHGTPKLLKPMEGKVFFRFRGGKHQVSGTQTMRLPIPRFAVRANPATSVPFSNWGI